MTSSTPETLSKFVQFCHQHITGQERKEAQTFLDRFFRAFGHEGALEAGATYEEAIKKSSKTGKTGFADLVWKPRVLIEMKKRGEDLNKHYRQAFDYWTRLVPNRPKYVILCNFNEFWIFDFDIQLDTPVDKITLEQLPERSGALAFMELGQKTPVFQNNQVEVTVKAARRMGELLLELESRGIEKLTAQRFILQCVLAMFAEDRQLLPRDMFISCVQDCMKGGSSYDVLGGLFREMNQRGKTPAGRYQGVDYFNGGLFSQIHAIELTREELNFLDVSARENWSKVRPAIFGNLFEGSIYKEERHARGIHYTSEVDIMKIVRPTISRYWEERIEEATTIKELSKLQIELQSYRVLDPACGSGNFLYIAYQELKQIEKLLLEKIQSLSKSKDKQLQMGLVTPLQFYGMDTNPFAVELARVTLMIARKIAIDNLQLTEPALPLDTLDNNIVCQDALFSEWVKADAIIGNPPFLGGKKLRIELGDEYAEKIYKAFPDVKGQPDFCVFWFRKASDLLADKGRGGLVATNSISQVSGRKASLDYIVHNGGIIHDAISTQTWSGDAAVHVSIVNWTKEKQKQNFLDNVEVPFITSSLKSEISVTNAVKLQANKNLSFESCALGGKGFIISEEEAREWIKIDSKNANVLKPMIDGKTLINPYLTLDWVIDFNDMSIEQASEYELPLKRVEEKVKPQKDINRSNLSQTYWWRFRRYSPAMRKALKGLECYFAIPKIAKYILFSSVDISILPCEANMVIASDDFYILGIINSKIHQTWVKAQSSTLEDRTRYTNTTCFETFPFPQTADMKIVQQIRTKAEELHQYRTQQMETKQWGITTLYNKFFNEPSSQLYQLHQQLDKLVMTAYNIQTKDDILEKLLILNKELAEKEKQGIKIIGPGSPN
ncbi:class I SAM-dependent DNA methyltransferase [Anabaena sp. UHCC 0187]|uniref:DNA methyltransferase n=1 Tax=Anabaena sp. UHCC 0187 TaxID=2590018 RepID=UPI001445DD82|nr:DNA methyltransferase [Anabaena sp. UHCC 0187]MTJ12704.1 class I SAM-dependent DNA methyltransferase [Anabaena sp. UHCC 0187]